MRKVVDCREQPSESNCSLTIAGEEEEVVRAAAEHAVSVHGHVDDEALRAEIRSALRDEDTWTGTGFVQVIEFQTDRYDDGRKLVDQWEKEIGADRTAIRALQGRDRERPDRYVTVVEFPSYEQAMKNSSHPATQRLAEQLGKLTDDDPVYRNLDVVMDRRV